MIVKFESENADFISAVAGKSDHVDYELIRYADGSVDVLTGADIPSQPVPEVVSQCQIWEELIDRGMLEAAKSAAAADGPIMENYFMRSNEYQRRHPKTAEVIALFGMTPEQGDDLFRSAGKR